jgi:ferredoxin
MSYVITRACRDCIDTACVSVCPFECIYQHDGSGDEALPNQLFINPDECTHCGACEPACPWEAIRPEDEAPEPDVLLNALTMKRPQEFSLPALRKPAAPTREQVEANLRRWGLAV